MGRESGTQLAAVAQGERATHTVEGVAPGSIVVGVDGSPGSNLALDWAAEQARLEDRPLAAVHGVPNAALFAYESALDPASFRDAAWSEGRRRLRAARDHVRDVAPMVTVQELILDADARELLDALSARAAMVVVGSRGRGPIGALLLGSVSVHVCTHAASPVVVVRPQCSDQPSQGILVGAISAAESAAALEFAYRQAAIRRLPLTVLHTVRAESRARPQEEATALALSEVVAELRVRFPEVTSSLVTARGAMEGVLVERSASAGLIVVGTHRSGRLARLLVSSVARIVVEHADCPVAVIPEESR